MIFKWIGIKDFYYYFLFLQGVVSYLVLKILNKRGYQSSLVYTAYFCFVTSSYSFGLLRQSIAISIFFLAIDYFLEKNLLSYFLLILIGVFFHRTLLIMFVLPLILKKRIKIYQISLVMLILIMNYFQLINLNLGTFVEVLAVTIGNKSLMNKVFYYSVSGDFDYYSLIGYTFFKMLIIFILLNIIKKNVKLEEEKFNILYNLGIIYPMLYFILIDFSNIGYRVALYFQFFSYLLIMEYLPGLFQNKRLNSIIKIGLLFFIILEKVIRVYRYKEYF